MLFLSKFSFLFYSFVLLACSSSCSCLQGKKGQFESKIVMSFYCSITNTMFAVRQTMQTRVTNKHFLFRSIIFLHATDFNEMSTCFLWSFQARRKKKHCKIMYLSITRTNYLSIPFCLLSKKKGPTSCGHDVRLIRKSSFEYQSIKNLRWIKVCKSFAFLRKILFSLWKTKGLSTFLQKL